MMLERCKGGRSGNHLVGLGLAQWGGSRACETVVRDCCTGSKIGICVRVFALPRSDSACYRVECAIYKLVSVR